MWLVSADARGGGTRDESLRVSAWDANRLYPSAKFYIDVAPSVFVIFFYHFNSMDLFPFKY